MENISSINPTPNLNQDNRNDQETQVDQNPKTEKPKVSLKNILLKNPLYDLTKVPKRKLILGASGIIGGILFILVVLPIITSLLRPRPPIVTKPEPKPETSENLVEINPEEQNGFKTYTNQKFEFSIKYPAKATFLEPGTYDAPLETYRILFAGEKQDKELIEIEDIVDGYILNFTIHKQITNQNLDSLTKEKRNSYIILCNDTATIGEITTVSISDYNAKRFEVQNCGVDYIQTMFLRNGDLIEITQAYRGDIGFKQVYRAETTDIVNMFKILNTLKPTPIDTWKTYEVERILTFKYPAEYDLDCCTMNGPLETSAEKVAVFADPKTVENSQNNQFNGFGVFFDDNRGKIPFLDYVENQKNLLQENYRLVVGLNPIVDSETKEINGRNWTILKGYAWWGNLAFTETTDGKIVIFVRTELKNSAIDFDEVFNDILKTVEFSE